MMLLRLLTRPGVLTAHNASGTWKRCIQAGPSKIDAVEEDESLKVQHDLWTQLASYASEGSQGCEILDDLPETQGDWLGKLTEGKATSFPVRIPGLSLPPRSPPGSRREFSTSTRSYARVRPGPGPGSESEPIKFPAHPNPSP